VLLPVSGNRNVCVTYKPADESYALRPHAVRSTERYLGWNGEIEIERERERERERKRGRWARKIDACIKNRNARCVPSEILDDARRASALTRPPRLARRSPSTLSISSFSLFPPPFFPATVLPFSRAMYFTRAVGFSRFVRPLDARGGGNERANEWKRKTEGDRKREKERDCIAVAKIFRQTFPERPRGSRRETFLFMEN